MANINSNPTHVAKIGYNGFDMSHTLKFSSTVGELLPVFYDILQPGDKVSLKSTIKSRTLPLGSPAMVKIKEHIEWFFVPMKQIYSLFGAWYFGISDLESSLYNPALLKKDLPFQTPQAFTSSLDSLQVESDQYFPIHKGTGFRLLEMLGVPLRYQYDPNGTDVFPLSMCPILACAYQKIFYDFYRDSEREQNDPIAYNLDNYSMQSMPVGYTYWYRLRYRRWRPDFFTHGFTSPIFGAISTNAFSGMVTSDPDRLKLTDSFSQWLLSANYNSYLIPGFDNVSQPTSNQQSPTVVEPVLRTNSFNDTTSVPRSLPYPGSVAAALSPTAIRTSFAVQKLLEVTRRAGKHYDAQQLAHFGVKMNNGIAGECTFIGATESDFVIGDVISTADTTSAPLGQLAGKGYNQDSSRRMSFDASCHGILMAIYSAEPIADYSDKGYDYLNTLLDRSSWPTPEYDNLGMQPMFMYQNNISAAYNDPYNTTILRWKYRYFPFKEKYNKVCGALTHSLSYWTPQRYSMGNVLNSYYIDPNYLDEIMLASYSFDLDSDWTHQYDTDPLIHEIYFDVKKSSKMSTFGLEQL